MLVLITVVDLRKTFSHRHARSIRTTTEVSEGQCLQILDFRQVAGEELVRQSTFLRFRPSSRVVGDQSDDLGVHPMQVEVAGPVKRMHPCSDDVTRVPNIVQPCGLHDSFRNAPLCCPGLDQSSDSANVLPAGWQLCQQFLGKLAAIGC